jgi:hypothetical protein
LISSLWLNKWRQTSYVLFPSLAFNINNKRQFIRTFSTTEDAAAFFHTHTRSRVMKLIGLSDEVVFFLGNIIFLVVKAEERDASLVDSFMIPPQEQNFHEFNFHRCGEKRNYFQKALKSAPPDKLSLYYNNK